MNPKIRNKFSNIDPVYAPVGEEDKTQQHFRDECNINQIIAKYNKTGIIQHVSRNRQRFGEFMDLADHAINLDKVAKAQQSFDQLPSAIRNEFGNSITGFFEFIKKPQNKQQCIDWGIFDAPKENPKAAVQPAGVPSTELNQGSDKKGSFKKPKTILEPSDD